MQLHLLEAFLTVARHGRINRAADDLHVSQPTLSRQMLSLERSLRVTLFERHARGVKLTKAGEALKEEAQEILARVQSLEEDLRSGEHRTSIVRLGVPPGIPDHWLRERLDGTVPEGIRVSLIEAPTDDQLTLLARNELDVVLARRQVESYPTRLVVRQRLGMVVRMGSSLQRRLATADSASLEHLEGLRVMAHSRGEIRIQEDVLKNAMRSAGLDARWIFRSFGRHSELIADLAEVDTALTTEASAAVNFPTWRWIPLAGHDATGRDLEARTWLTWTPTPTPEAAACVALFPDMHE